MHEWQVILEFETSEMIERAALGVSLARVLLVSELACVGKIFIPAKKKSRQSKKPFLPKMGYMCFRQYSHRRQGFVGVLVQHVT
jgi:hypothetical protein